MTEDISSMDIPKAAQWTSIGNPQNHVSLNRSRKTSLKSTYLNAQTVNGESDRDVCDEDSMVEIDFDRYVGSTPVSNWNADTLWAARKPYGFDYDND